MSKFLIRWSPEGGSIREWPVDFDNPPWAVRLKTEEVTGWPWDDFRERIAKESAIAWRALLWSLRIDAEPKLALGAVTVDFDELEIDEIPEPEKVKKARGKAADEDPA